MIFMGKTLVSKGLPGSCRQVKNLKAAKLEVLHAKQHWEAGIQQENQKIGILETIIYFQTVHIIIRWWSKEFV